MSLNDAVLIAVIKTQQDMYFAREQHWYRVPVEQADSRLKKSWPPGWLAFYQPKVFGVEAYAIHYYTQVRAIGNAYRWQLFPDESKNAASEKLYYRFELAPLERLPRPIYSPKHRRITFMTTTLAKLLCASEIGEL